VTDISNPRLFIYTKSFTYPQIRPYSTSGAKKDTILGPYLAGLIEGDGYIGVQAPDSKSKVVH
jgi:hypothetical protein